MKFIFAVTALGFIGALFVLGIIITISFDLPQINSLADYNPAIPSRIYSKDGELLLELAKERRTIAQFDEIPQRIIDAFLSAEDDNFYNHSGVDYVGIARAMVKNIKAGRIVQGASTITQQVAKSLLLSSERTYTRKIKDLLLAKRIEDKFTKEEILFLYLNQVYLGGGYYGVKSAFRGYFEKELSEATVAEAALVAGLLVAPGKYSPYVNPQYAKTRQKYVLGRMATTGKISQAEYEEAIKEDIRMKLREPNLMKAGYFTDWVRQRAIEKFGEEDFLTGGYEVVTTLDWSLQKKAEEEVWDGVKAIDKRQGYKGPLTKLETPEDKFAFLEKQRKQIYDETSLYFTFFADGTTKPEYEYQENELQTLLDFEKEEFNQIKSRWKNYIEIGIPENDEFHKFVEIGKNYKAVVTKVSNSQRMIYVSVGGVKGMIPYEGFRWAHERNITEDRHYWSYVTHPESILSPGDVVNVYIKGQARSIWGYLHSDFRGKVKGDDVALFKKQNFLLMDLDQEPDAQGALLAISPHSGEIISMVGGSDFRKSQFNRAVQSNRQPGSAFKPILFAVGLENGFTPASILLDSPQALGGVDDSLSWKPRNYDGSFKGEMTFRKALEISRNIPTIRLTQDVGVMKVKNFVEQRLKVDTELPKDLSVSLGSFGMNLLDLVKAYSIFPNGGKKLKIKSIVSVKDRHGKVLYLEDREQDPALAEEEKKKLEQSGEAEVALASEAVASEEKEAKEEEKKIENPFLVNLNDDQVYDPRLAYLMTNLLKGVIQNGTGKGARHISSFIGGKTGTTNNYVDAWFLGFSSKIVTGVWTGFDDNQTLGWGETGAKSALPIWKAFMDLGINKYGETDFPIPSGIVNVAIDAETGKLAKSNTSDTMMEAFVEGTEPGAVVEKNEEEDTGSTDITNSFLEDEEYYISQ